MWDPADIAEFLKSHSFPSKKVPPKNNFSERRLALWLAVGAITVDEDVGDQGQDKIEGGDMALGKGENKGKGTIFKQLRKFGCLRQCLLFL